MEMTFWDIIGMIVVMILFFGFFVAGIVAFKGAYYIEHPFNDEYKRKWTIIVSVCVLYMIICLVVGIGYTLLFGGPVPQ